jgi:hypothetical protein
LNGMTGCPGHSTQKLMSQNSSSLSIII